MSLPVLPVQSSNLPIPHPFTPTIPLYSRTDDSTCERHSQASSKAADNAWTAPFRDGLPTPPNDMTGLAYPSYPSSHYGGKLDDISLPPYVRPHSNSHMRYSTSTTTTTSNKVQPSIQEPSSSVSEKKGQANGVASYLQMPSSVNNGKGNLAEFAAQMTCLFWFEGTVKLNAIEDRLNPPYILVPESMPSAGFQKWVTNILSTTQVSQNVVLLALMFIYRLKKTNSRVRGKKGSEYRLMTIALMLGNKFLDDNTYTNKTWAEVSGISVQEIHVMEVEFLSNVRYNLFVSSEEWAKWHVKLGLFADFFNNALRAPEKNDLGLTPPMLRMTNSELPSRVQLSPSSKLPSPPDLDPLRTQAWTLPSNGPAYPSAPQVTSEMPPVASRKRTREDYGQEPTSKRMAMPNPMPTPMSTISSSSLNTIPSLPPVLTPTSVPSQANISAAVSRLPPPNFTPTHGLVSNLPTSVPQYASMPSRAMPPMYNPSTNWIPSLPPSTAVPPVTSGLYNASLSLPDPGRPQNSPYGVSSAAVSPAVSAYSVHTPQTHLSPSFFLANRNSPYRPVRNVNTLLIPPPSSSLQQQRNIPFDHMHYQPLGKTAAERKTGLLPYIHPEAWAQAPLIPPTLHSTPSYSS
ncbi:hypothetical protein FE257_005490 [Aspergillus nanangensis]|uniref:Mucin n=1 Tax=Aspergillus nanangensis TaxID=2582783 RepID=A0AAD4GMV8_ASPNN|nr:hypothetical protein FE257_005490 [Aspergillus nanangensis]